MKHTKWECKYHVVFIPKCRRKVNDLSQVMKSLLQRFTRFFTAPTTGAEPR